MSRQHCLKGVCKRLRTPPGITDTTWGRVPKRPEAGIMTVFQLPKSQGIAVKRALLPESLPAVLYARVSSEEQEKEGYSIPAQTKSLHGYATEEGIKLVREFIDVETAKQPGRPGFMEMVDFFAKEAKKDPQRRVRTLLVEKTDRLYRNLKDYVTIDDLKIDIHFVKENVILSPDSHSSEKFMHGIKVSDGQELRGQPRRRGSQGDAGKGGAGHPAE